MPADDLTVETTAAAHHVVFDGPSQPALRILLDVARHVRVAAPANGDVKRWPRPSRIGQSLAKSDLFDEAFRRVNVLDAIFRIAPPLAVAMDLNLLGQHAADSIKLICVRGQSG